MKYVTSECLFIQVDMLLAIVYLSSVDELLDVAA